MKRRILVITIVLALLFSLMAIPVQAATEAEKQNAIDTGLAWLAGQQQVDGIARGIR